MSKTLHAADKAHYNTEW